MIPGRSAYDRGIHTRSIAVKAVLGTLTGWMPCMRPPRNDLVVVGYHGTEKRSLHNFEKQVRFLKDTFAVISPGQLSGFFENRLADSDKPFLLFSFDDGIKNNVYAAEILRTYDIRAFFFVVPEFINRPAEEQAAFFLKNIRPGNGPCACGSEDAAALSWAELRQMAAAGHEIGSHSATHGMRMISLDTASRLHEIVESRRMVAEGLNVRPEAVRAFCGPVDSRLSVGRKEMALIRQHYSFFFSTLPGSNSVDRDPYFIRRVHLEDFWMLAAVRFALSNLERLRWKHKTVLFRDACRMEQFCVQTGTG